MKGKIVSGGKFNVTDVRQLPDELRANPLVRELVAAKKDEAQAQIVLDNANVALEQAKARVAAAEKIKAAAKDRQEMALAALEAAK